MWSASCELWRDGNCGRPKDKSNQVESIIFVVVPVYCLYAVFLTLLPLRPLRLLFYRTANGNGIALVSRIRYLSKIFKVDIIFAAHTQCKSD